MGFIDPGQRPKSHYSQTTWRHLPKNQEAELSKLVLVLSVPRSGTEALLSLMKERPGILAIEEEFFSGYIRDPTLKLLLPDFPWIAEWKKVADLLPDGQQRQAASLAYHNLMNENAIEVTEGLLALRENPVVVKLLPTHLDWGNVDQILQRWKPRTIILRRRLIFSYISLLKATETGRFFNQDNTLASIQLNNDAAYHYIAETDHWFDHVYAACDRLNVPTLDVTFEDTFESNTQQNAIMEFLGIDPSGPVVVPSTVRQDRRTEASLVESLRSFGSLPLELQNELLRLPGHHLNQ